MAAAVLYWHDLPERPEPSWEMPRLPPSMPRCGTNGFRRLLGRSVSAGPGCRSRLMAALAWGRIATWRRHPGHSQLPRRATWREAGVTNGSYSSSWSTRSAGNRLATRLSCPSWTCPVPRSVPCWVIPAQTCLPSLTGRLPCEHGPLLHVSAGRTRRRLRGSEAGARPALAADRPAWKDLELAGSVAAPAAASPGTSLSTRSTFAAGGIRPLPEEGHLCPRRL